MNDRWKLEYYFEQANGRLFDRTQDPDEQLDLYDQSDLAFVQTQLLTALLAWYSDVTDVQWLKDHSSGGGPIARMTAKHTRAMSGTDADERLNLRISALNAAEGCAE